MNASESINTRIKILKNKILEINICYNDTLKDDYVDWGIQYEKGYDLEDVFFRDVLNQIEITKNEKIYDLYEKIFTFSQAYYSLKEYLNKIHPEKHQSIENFFSNEKIDFISRKDICNDIKHNPNNDLTYKIGIVNKESIISKDKHIEQLYFKRTWFYKGKDSIKFCNELYKDLLEFLKNEKL